LPLPKLEESIESVGVAIGDSPQMGIIALFRGNSHRTSPLVVLERTGLRVLHLRSKTRDETRDGTRVSNVHQMSIIT
jgi:hypothetical protein